MKVSDIMHRSVVTVTEDTTLKEVGRLIFSLGIAGIPVVRGKKLVGLITEEDILSRMHPTIQDVIEDYSRARNFELMVKNLHGILDESVGEVMNHQVTTVTPDTPVMQAHSVMLINKFSRLPIVNKNHELVGIISQGDVFRSILKDEMPRIEKERYAGFISQYYDKMVNWEKRFDDELPSLFSLFEREKIKNVLDIGVWTGEYSIGMAKRSKYSILGLDHNPIMVKMANEKKDKLQRDVRNRINFILTDFMNIPALTSEKFDAMICMGNSLPYIPVKPDMLLKGVDKVMGDNGVVIIQLLNIEKILKSKSRILSFGLQKGNTKGEKEQLSIEFFDIKDKDHLLHNTIIFDNDGVNWIYKGITTIEIFNIKKEGIEAALKKNGFKNVAFYGGNGEYQGEYGKISFSDKFDPLNSDWLNVVAKR